MATPPPFQSAVIRGGGSTQVTNRVERSASYSAADAGSENKPVFGWTNKVAAGRGGGRRGAGGAAGNPQQRKDWSKLFATPEPEPVQGRPLVGLSRSFGAVAQRSCYSSPLFLGMLLLVYTFSPLVAAQSLVGWGLGRLAYWVSMRGEDVSVRMPAGFVGYASLFLVVGGMVFMNGLKGISSLALI